jgi:hypothetical protein
LRDGLPAFMQVGAAFRRDSVGDEPMPAKAISPSELSTALESLRRKGGLQRRPSRPRARVGTDARPHRACAALTAMIVRLGLLA